MKPSITSKNIAVRAKNYFYSDELVQSWIVRNLQIIGEAASRISDEIMNHYPNIPWKKIIGMRHVLVHGYFEVDLDVVWAVIEHDFPQLQIGFQKIRDDLGTDH